MNRPKPKKTKYEILMERSKRRYKRGRFRRNLLREAKIAEVTLRLDKEVDVWRHAGSSAAQTQVVMITNNVIFSQYTNHYEQYLKNEQAEKSKKPVRVMGRKGRKA